MCVCVERERERDLNFGYYPNLKEGKELGKGFKRHATNLLQIINTDPLEILRKQNIC